jgi:hypothetical protein
MPISNLDVNMNFKCGLKSFKYAIKTMSKYEKINHISNNVLKTPSTARYQWHCHGTAGKWVQIYLN